MSDRVYYAIGDVHGEAERLAALHAAILADQARRAKPATLVHLGDLVDRGPDSRAVIAQVRRLHAEPPAGFEVVTLMGNHERMMLDAIAARSDRLVWHWLRNGGDETLASYAQTEESFPDDPLDAIPREDVVWMAALPNCHRDAARKLFFVHAGIEPDRFPACDEEVRLWTRSERFFDERRWPSRPELEGLLVVHGHTPTEDFKPDAHPRRLNVDTGAVFGGPLTCAVLAPGEPPQFLTA